METKVKMPGTDWWAVTHGNALYGIYSTPESAQSTLDVVPQASGPLPLYTAQQLEDYAAARVAEALEHVGAGGVKRVLAVVEQGRVSDIGWEYDDLGPAYQTELRFRPVTLKIRFGCGLNQRERKTIVDRATTLFNLPIDPDVP